MNWDAITAIAEVVGVVAVVITLFYLSREVRANTNAMRASAGFDSTQTMSELNLTIAEWVLSDTKYQEDGEARLTGVIKKLYDPEAKPSDLTPSDHLVIGFLHRAGFNKFEGEYYLYQHGFLDAAHWEARKAWIRGFISLPIAKVWWENEMRQSSFRPEFVAEISSREMAELVMPGQPRTISELPLVNYLNQLPRNRFTTWIHAIDQSQLLLGINRH